MPASQFYLGRWAADGAGPTPVLYDPADLTTHAVVIGMTGSGKTGLLISLLEEAARQGLPAIVIDPKGDLTNLLLHFPELRPEDFAPWVDPEAARRAAKTPEELAAAAAARWREGLAGWDLGPTQLAELRDAVDYTVYTPGSTAGTPVNLLSSFDAPPADGGAGDGQEARRERIASIVTALLGLIGLTEIDPLRSREHILIANILEHAWGQGQPLDLAGLIEQITAPPFDRLGAFPLQRFFPEKDRFELALLLNNFLAAPSFQTWLQGQPLDVPALLRTPQGQPRFSIFYLAHLSETERMFFVTLLLAAVEGWMRTQRGSSGLRALLAFDEITGYLPPVANPPSRPVLLRLLKQARAFGLGIVLATQNPVDLNYKALSNAGTWFIGRLQTEQDKQRLLDGLQALESGIDRAAFDKMIGGLKPRLFLLHNIHQSAPRIMQSRWALNYLAGPLTRAQIPLLPGRTSPPVPPARPAVPGAAIPGAAAVPGAAAAYKAPPAGPIRPPAPKPAPRAVLSAAPPALPDAVSQFYFPATVSLQRALAAQGGALRGPLEPQGVIYKPAVLAQAEVRYFNRRYNLDDTRRPACLVPDPDPLPDWAVFVRPAFDPAAFAPSPLADARYAPLPAAMSGARALSALQKDFLEWVYRTAGITVRACEPLKIYAGPRVSDEDFRRQLDNAASTGMQSELDKTAAGYDSRLEVLARRIERQQASVDRREDALGVRKNEQAAADFDFLTGLLGGRKRSASKPVTRRRLTTQARSELVEARELLDRLQTEWKALADERQSALQRIQAAWRERAAQVSAVPISPLKKDVLPALFGVAWLPYYQVNSPDGLLELPAF